MGLFTGLHFIFLQNHFWGDVYSSSSEEPQKKVVHLYGSMRRNQITTTTTMVEIG